MRTAIYLVCLMLLAGNSRAQEIWPPAPKASFITRFPFKQYSGGVIVIGARINDIKDTFNFILDTGSGGISLDSATCAQYQITTLPTDTVITGMGGAHKVNFAFHTQLRLPGLDLPDLNFHVNDYEAMSGVYGEKIDGIIGYSFFSRYLVKINFDSSWIEVFSPGEMNYPRGGTLIRPVFTRLPMVELSVKDHRKIPFDFYFDTGAGLCFLMSDRFASDSNILQAKRQPILTRAEGMGGKVMMRQTVVKMLQVGRFKFRNVPTYLYPDEFNVTAYPSVGGLLGNDLLRRFNIILNYPKREIHLLPNGHFKEPFDYAYTGFSIYYENGNIIVEDVIKDGPADKAGIQVNDVIIGVNTNFTNNIMQYKDLLQSARENIQVVLRREGRLIQVKIKPLSIL